MKKKLWSHQTATLFPAGPFIAGILTYSTELRSIQTKISFSWLDLSITVERHNIAAVVVVHYRFTFNIERSAVGWTLLEISEKVFAWMVPMQIAWLFIRNLNIFANTNRKKYAGSDERVMPWMKKSIKISSYSSNIITIINKKRRWIALLTPLNFWLKSLTFPTREKFLSWKYFYSVRFYMFCRKPPFFLRIFNFFATYRSLTE